MNYIATITSKRQLTIPADIFADFNLQEGEKVVISSEKDTIKITPALKLVNRLAGSIAVPERFKNLNPEEMITKAKNEHFQK